MHYTCRLFEHHKPLKHATFVVSQSGSDAFKSFEINVASAVE